jgi:hypothetical protein
LLAEEWGGERRRAAVPRLEKPLLYADIGILSIARRLAPARALAAALTSDRDLSLQESRHAQNQPRCTYSL